MDRVLPPGLGAGRRSAQAEARLARGVGDPPMARPDLDDRAAVARWRAAIHAAWGEGTEADEPTQRPIEVAGIAALASGPDDAPMTVLYLHGGGYALGSAGVAAPITARLAAAGLRVVSIDYRLAPEHPFPAALDDAVAAHGALRAGERPVAVAGDSAGGALAVGVTLRAALEGAIAPVALALFCPHLAHEADHDAGNAAGDEAGGRTGEAVAALAAAYRNGHDPTDPLLSPLFAPAALLASLPPTLVQTGTLDALHPQALRFARLARAAGASVTLDVWEGLWHTWQYHRDLPEADRALAEAARFLTGAAAG
ncbi:MAG: alpha/beta hydrolase [Acidimicrobiales bacterium]|nr:alpha/beta hydrolase [Acidimicrobiales bacterium]